VKIKSRKNLENLLDFFRRFKSLLKFFKNSNDESSP
jgi:hypothetical protein